MYNRDMAFTVADYSDLIKLLREHPEWREELRREILDDEFLKLPEYVKQNSVDIQALQVVVAQNSADIDRNTSAIERNTLAIDRLVAEMHEFRVAAEARFDAIDRVLRLLRVRSDRAEGDRLELKFRFRAPGYFGRRIRRVRVVSPEDLALFADADEQGTLSDADALAVRKLDLLVTGREGRGPGARDIMLAVEVSAAIDGDDVLRAADRAGVLRSIGYPNVLPMVVGYSISPMTEMLARDRGVEWILDEDQDETSRIA